MKIQSFILIISLFFTVQSTYALNASADVKVNTLLKAQTSWDGNTLVYPQGKAEVTGMMIEIAVGGETGWHLHTVPSFGVVLEGELEVHLKNGAVKLLHAGDALAEVVNTYHNGKNIGKVPVKIFVVYTGTAGQLLTKMEP